jgi:hypothetical protein
MAVFLHVGPCNLVETDRRFSADYCLHRQNSKSNKLVNFYQNTRRNFSEDSHIHTRRREILKSHITFPLQRLFEGIVCSLCEPYETLKHPMGKTQSFWVLEKVVRAITVGF